jgi:hypothetical protein
MASPLMLAPAAFLVAAGLLSEDLGSRAEEINAAFLRCEAQMKSPAGLTPEAEKDLLLTWKAFHRELEAQARRSSELSAGRAALDPVVSRDSQFLAQARREGAFAVWKAHREELTESLRKARGSDARPARVAVAEAR